MIVTSRVHARTYVDNRTLTVARFDVISAVEDKLRAAVVLEGEQIGAFIRTQSVRVIQQEPDHDEVIRGLTPFYAMWSPLEAELRGGAADGRIISAPMDTKVFPVRRCRVLTEPSVPDLVAADTLTPEALDNVVTYWLQGVDSESDHWVYTVTPL